MAQELPSLSMQRLTLLPTLLHSPQVKPGECAGAALVHVPPAPSIVPVLRKLPQLCAGAAVAAFPCMATCHQTVSSNSAWEHLSPPSRDSGGLVSLCPARGGGGSLGAGTDAAAQQQAGAGVDETL